MHSRRMPQRYSKVVVVRSFEPSGFKGLRVTGQFIIQEDHEKWTNTAQGRRAQCALFFLCWHSKSKAGGHTRQGDVDLRERKPEFEKQEREN